MSALELAAEPLSVLQARYPLALEFVYSAVQIMKGGIRPGEVAANVFVFEDGLRLHVSRERMPDGMICLHVSASIVPDMDLWRFMKEEIRQHGVDRPFVAWVEHVQSRWKELSGDERKLRLACVVGAVPHYFIEEDE